MDSRAVWTSAENLAPPLPTGTPSPDRPARSESLYRLRYPGPHSKLSRLCLSNYIGGIYQRVSSSLVILYCTSIQGGRTKQ